MLRNLGMQTNVMNGAELRWLATALWCSAGPAPGRGRCARSTRFRSKHGSGASTRQAWKASRRHHAPAIPRSPCQTSATCSYLAVACPKATHSLPASQSWTRTPGPGLRRSCRCAPDHAARSLHLKSCECKTEKQRCVAGIVPPMRKVGTRSCFGGLASRHTRASGARRAYSWRDPLR